MKYKAVGFVSLIALVVIVFTVAIHVGKPTVKPRNCKNCEGVPSSELWAHLQPKPDPFWQCSTQSMEKTGKTRSIGARPPFTVHHETIRRWNCPDGDKVEVVWLVWRT